MGRDLLRWHPGPLQPATWQTAGCGLRARAVNKSPCSISMFGNTQYTTEDKDLGQENDRHSGTEQNGSVF